jgi:hypothetical protein
LAAEDRKSGAKAPIEASLVAPMRKGRLGAFDKATSWISFESEDTTIDPTIPLEIGRIVLRWTSVEQAFDTDIELLSKHPGVARLLPPEIPNAFGKKLKLWTRLLGAAFPDIPRYIGRAENIRARASDLADWRNNLVHGLVTVEGGEIKIINFKRVAHARTAKIYTGIQRNRLMTISQDMKHVADEVIAFGINHTLLRSHLATPEPT